MFLVRTPLLASVVLLVELPRYELGTIMSFVLAIVQTHWL